MNGELKTEIAALGRDIVPAMLQGTMALFAPLHDSSIQAAELHRDRRYGPDERHRLDVFVPPDSGTARRPVLLFVHGGGFVRGDKTTPGSPFYDNVGHFAAVRGWLGVTMTYRLAPANPWPSGGEDVGRAVEWVAKHCAEFGGDRERIFLMGQSAGAVHAATYVAFSRFHGERGRALAGAVFLSGIYDLPSSDRNEFQAAYFGGDDRLYGERSALPGLLQTDLPLLATVAELDPDGFQRQAALYVERMCHVHGRYPRMLYLSGHNHLSPVLQVGLPIDTLGPEIEAFVSAN
jgi:arylformamidase